LMSSNIKPLAFPVTLAAPFTGAPPEHVRSLTPVQHK
jgi:hypothetical protein